MKCIKLIYVTCTSIAKIVRNVIGKQYSLVEWKNKKVIYYDKLRYTRFRNAP